LGAACLRFCLSAQSRGKNSFVAGQGWIKFHLAYARLFRQRNRQEYAGVYGAATAISEKMLFADGVRKTCTGADILLPAREAAFIVPFLILQSAFRLFL